MRLAVLMTRQAISPRLAIRILRNTLSPVVEWPSPIVVGRLESVVNPSRSSAIFLSDIHRRVGHSLFRLHIENGLAVTLAMAVVVVGGGILFGREVMALGATGALYASIVDQPGPLGLKARIFVLDIAAAAIVTLLASLAGGIPWLLGPLIIGMGFSTGMLVAYGRRAVGLGVAADL